MMKFILSLAHLLCELFDEIHEEANDNACHKLISILCLLESLAIHNCLRKKTNSL